MLRALTHVLSSLMLVCSFTTGAACSAQSNPPASVGSGAVYYVNSNTGNDGYAGTSTKMPFKTISRAARLVNPGDVVYVMSGTYPEQVYLTRSGSAVGGYITFQAYPGAKPLMTNYNEFAAFNFSANESYIIIDGFTIVGDAKSLTLAQAQALVNNTTSTVNNGSCITAKGNHIVIRNNELSYCPGAGLGLSGDYMWAYNNIVHHNSYWSPVDASGISVRGTDSDSSTQTKIWIYNNIVFENQNFICNVLQTSPCKITDGEGIIADSNVDTGFRGRTLIYNNVSYCNGGPGIEAYRSAHVDIVNNTTYVNNRSGVEPGALQGHVTTAEVEVGYASDVRVLNNILYSRTSAPILSIFGTTALEWDYNIHYNSVGQLGGSGMGSHNLIANPLFRNALLADFRLEPGSPAINAGTLSFQPTLDFAGLSTLKTINTGALLAP
jgi:Protein of unknown function (DUF1565)